MLTSTRLHTNNPLKCPECNKLLDGATGAGAPQEGAISICLYCQSINKFSGKGMQMRIIKMTDEEKEQLKSEHPQVWQQIWEYIYTIKEVLP
jgi:phage FluMu protein Com